MSLQIWLPLNKEGDYENRGVGDMNIISNTTQYNSTGKIGGCLLGDADHRFVIECQDWFKFNPSTKFSVALWVKGCTSGDWLLACSSWEIMFRTTTIRFYPSETSTYYPAYWNTTIDPNKWYHICGTWDGCRSCLYVDGDLKCTTEIPETATFYDFWSDRRFVIPHSGVRYINDFRLYDHTLSLKEVKEISQGLVLHYKFDDIINPNLLNPINNNSSDFDYEDGVYSNNRVDGWNYIRFYISHNKDGVNTDFVAAKIINKPGHYSYTFTTTSTTDHLNFAHSGKNITLRPFNMGSITASPNTTYTFSMDVLSSDPSVIGGLKLARLKLENSSVETTYAPYNIINDNLFIFDTREYTQDNPFTISSSSKQYYTTSCKIKALNLDPGKTYTFSCCTNAIVEDESKSYPGTSDFIFYLYTSSTDNIYSWPSTGKYIRFSPSYNSYKEEDYNKYSWRFTIPEGYTACCVRVTRYADGTNAITSKYWDFKLEEGEVTTSITPDTLDKICYDSSGYGIDGDITTTIDTMQGIKTGTLTVQSNSIRYDKCIKFSESGIILKNIPSFSDNKITISFWINPDELSNKPNGTGGYKANGIITYRNDVDKDIAVFLSLNQIVFAAGGSTRFDFTYNEDWIRKWHLIGLTYDGSYKNLYIDGELIQSVSLNSNISINATRGVIGISDGDGDYFDSNNYYYGLLSDFRIYSTALSAEDIKDLYNTSTIIDNKGILHTRELKESVENIFRVEDMIEENFFLDHGKYTRLYYLESDGNQYIKTNIKIDTSKDTYSAYCRFKINTYGQYNGIFGVYTSESHNAFRVIEGATDTSLIGSGNTQASIRRFTYNLSSSQSITNIFEVRLSSSNMYVGDTSATASDPQYGTNDTPYLCLFSDRDGSNRFIGRIYDFYMYDGDTKIIDLIPCRRNSDNVVGLYDKVSGTFYTNSGAGSFVASPPWNYFAAVPEYKLRNGELSVQLHAHSFYFGNYNLNSTSHLGKYFKPGKQYKFDFWLDTDDVYYFEGSKNVPGGPRVYYTDGTSTSLLCPTGDRDNPKGFQHVVYYSDPNKTVRGISIYYFISTGAYYRSDSSITEVKDVDIQKSGIVEAPWLVDTKALLGIASQYDTNIYEEPDGSRWVRIFHHANPTSTNLFDSTDAFTKHVYKDENRWFDVSVCNQLSSWELMVKQKTSSSDTLQKYRWKQNVNPIVATYDDVTTDKVIYDTSSGYTSCSYMGLFKLGSNTYLSQGDYWWGAIGSWTYYTAGSGIPGWNKQSISETGYMDLYVRIDDTFKKETNIYDNKIECNSIIEF